MAATGGAKARINNKLNEINTLKIWEFGPSQLQMLVEARERELYAHMGDSLDARKPCNGNDSPYTGERMLFKQGTANMLLPSWYNIGSATTTQQILYFSIRGIGSYRLIDTNVLDSNLLFQAGAIRPGSYLSANLPLANAVVGSIAKNNDGDVGIGINNLLEWQYKILGH
jgi:hypothetical protein